MNIKLKILLLIFVLCSQAAAVNYPFREGYVNDFAKILPDDVKSRLKKKLSDYEKKTSIEVAVVTTPDLEGMTVEDWSIGLATKWGVGKKDKDNGLVIVVAPNERKMRIEVGYGIEGDLPDGKCGRIRDSFAIPNFRNKNYPKGIEETVDAVIAELGTKTIEERAAEKARLAEEKKKADEEQLRVIKWVGLAALLIIAIAVIIGLIVSAYNRRQCAIREAEEMKNKVLEGLQNIPEKISRLKKNQLKSLEILETLKQENPKDNWADLVSSAATIAGIFAAVAVLLDSARNKNLSENTELTQAYSDIAQAKEKLNDAESALGNISSRQKEIEEAKENYEKKIGQVDKKVQEALELAKKQDSEKEAKDKANKAKEKLDEARKLATGDGLVNWLTVALLIAAAMSLSEEAKSAATYVRRKDDDDSSGRGDDDDSDSYSSSYSSSSEESGGSDSGGGDFGGFGGGDFGGGGASGSW